MTTFIIIYSIFVVINIILFIYAFYIHYKEYEPITLLDIMVVFVASPLSFVATIILLLIIFDPANIIIFQRKD